MSPWPTQHLTADDLDAFHSGALSSEMRLHLETCDACRALGANDFEVVSALERLRPFAPAPGFVDRVMAQVVVGQPARVPLLSFPTLSRRRLAAVGALAAGLAASVVWSAANRTELEAWLNGIGAGLVQAGWAAVRSAAAAVAQQPWFETVRSGWLVPGRLAVAGGALVLAYGSGILALRRLLTPSAGPVSNASA